MKNLQMIDDSKLDKVQEIVRIVANTLDIPEGEIGLDTSMDNTPAWDSFEHMNICLALERQLGIKLNMDIITSGTSIRALAALIP